MNKCLNCKNKYHCCIAPADKGYIALSVSEAKKIKKATKLPYSEFLSFSKLPKKLIADSKKDFTGSEARMRYDLLIDNRLLRLKTSNSGKCIFLKKGECAICQIYPFWFNKEFEIILHPSLIHCDLIDKEFSMTDKEFKSLNKTAKKIVKESKNYKKEIKGFVKKNELL